MKTKYYIVLLVIFLLNGYCVQAQMITTIAGGITAGYAGDGGPATAAGFASNPQSVAVDASGNVYVAATLDYRVRKISTSGIITTVAGNGTSAYSGDNGPATAAGLNSPNGLAVDGSGNLYIATQSDGRVRKVTVAGIITTVAGNGTLGYSGDGGPATAAQLNSSLYGLAIDGSGNILIADYANNVIRRVSTTGIITTIAGNGTVSYSGDGGPATAAAFEGPMGVAADAAGNVYIADHTNKVIRKVNTLGIISTFAGGGGLVSDGIPATAASFNYTNDVVTDGSGNVFFSSYGRVAKVNTSGILTNLAGASYGDNGDGGAASVAAVSTSGLALDGSGNIYLAENSAYSLRKITVNVAPVTGATSVCAGSTTTLSDATQGGIWASANSAVATIDPQTGALSAVSSGTVIVSYGGSAFTTITVNTFPSAGTITGTATVCAAAATSLTDAVAGGTWSSSVTSIATVGSTGAVSGLSGGTSVISYSVTNSCGTAVATRSVTVTSLPSSGTITGASSVCAGASAPLSDGVAGGTWSSSVTSIAMVGSTGTVSGVSGGTAVISYSVTNGCGTSVATRSVTVNPLPVVAAIVGTATLCTAATTSLSDATSGGTWSSSTTAIAAVGTTGTVTGIAGGNAVISYSVTNGCGTTVATRSVTVSSSPNAGTITGASSVCTSATAALSDGISGGTWSSGNTGIVIAGTTGVVTGVSGGTAIISYSVNNGCGIAVATTSVTVNSLPSAGTITGTAVVCAGATTSLSDGAAGGSWSSSATGIAAVGSTGTVNGIAGGNAIISYSVTNGCGTTVAATSVTVNPLPVVAAVTGTATVCITAATALSDATPGGTWSSSATGNATVNNTGIVTGVAAGTATITYTVANGCGSTSVYRSVTINPSPSAGSITGPGSVCEGLTITLSDAAAAGTWSTGSASTATVSASGVITGVLAGSVTITYSVTNSCGTANATQSITVVPASVCDTANAVANIKTTQEIKIYPNPVSSIVHIAAPAKVNITLMDVTGRMLRQTDATDIDMSNLPGGIYFIAVYDENGVRMKMAKVIKSL